ncbi:MAG TPA: hypothetical protein VNI82_00150 [Candidatus Nitrosotenuis sp.]|nr:hypothetical protein [Candidatus Nitrosotenuis sp.]
MPNGSLYKKTVKVSEEYLGPAGERFIRRQISTHLNIKPESLDKKNLSQLIDWSSIAFALMTKNSKDIDSFAEDLKALTVKAD